MDETFDLGIGRGADGPDFVQRQGPFKNHAREPGVAQKTRHLGRTHRHLRRGVQLDRQIHPPQSHVLHDQRVDPGVDQLAGLPLGILQLAVPQQRVERGMHPHAEAMGILRHARDLPGVVSGSLPRTEPRAADIDGIGAAIYGRHGGSIIFGRSQQLDGFHAGHHFQRVKFIVQK